MTCSLKYAPQLRAQGMRMTAQRVAILHVLEQTGGHLSPTQIYDLARKEYPKLTEPTVYRTLEELAERKFLLAAHVGNGKMVYELAENHNHHHLICRECHAEVQIDHTTLKKLFAELESSTGYRFIDIHVTFFGLCPFCQNQKGD
ncbi:Zinc uptake regulation protein [Anaerolineales bacterium]|nr:Zinc uptake regulation protein [Anaerolineales bacterium]